MARRVVLETAGGVAAIFAARALVVDDDELDDDGRRRLSELVTAADDDHEAVGTGPGLLRDAQTYQITVEHPGGPSLVLSATDGSVPPPFAELRDWIRDNGRPAREPGAITDPESGGTSS